LGGYYLDAIVWRRPLFSTCLPAISSAPAALNLLQKTNSIERIIIPNPIGYFVGIHLNYTSD